MRSTRPTVVRTDRRSSTPPTRSPPSAPVILGRYRLTGRLGAGAFGTVWMGHDERLDRDVAVKILSRRRVEGGRFEREARAAARLAHPGIVTLYEAAVDDEGAYLVSELVRGSTMESLLAAGRLSDRDIVAIGIALCDALAHAHAQGVVHRDVKPSNVLVPEAPAGDAQLGRLTDFGVARVTGGDQLTVTGDVLGTLAYMAPEQAEGLDAGAPADLYSLALVVYEALTGVNPVAVATAAQRARRLGAHLPPLRRQRRDLPHGLAAGVDLALRPRPRERGTVADLRGALAAALDQVGDEPGLVGAPWPTQITAAVGPARTRRPEREPVWADDPGSDDLPSEDPPSPGGLAPPPAPSPAPPAPSPAPSAPAAPPAEVWPARAGAAVATAALTAWLTVNLLAPAPLPPAAAALIAAAAVLVAPRVGWLAVTLAVVGIAAGEGHLAAGLILLAAGLLPVVLLPAAPAAWPLSAAAPALGMIGLAGAWPALAARAATTWRRAVLAGLGWIWLLMATAISGRLLYLPRLAGMAPARGPGGWAESVTAMAAHVVRTIVSTGAWAPALVWMAAATLAPWLVYGRTVALDIVRVVVWAALLASATTTAIVAVHGSDIVGAPPTLVVGALACGAVVLAPSAVSAWRRALRSPGSGARVP